jgi:hypothetical protein
MNRITENEAKMKRCPFGADFSPIGGEIVSCFGSGCMAWRASYETEYLPLNVEPDTPGWEKQGESEGAVGGAVSQRQRWRRKVGFCGKVWNDTLT